MPSAVAIWPRRAVRLKLRAGVAPVVSRAPFVHWSVSLVRSIGVDFAEPTRPPSALVPRCRRPGEARGCASLLVAGAERSDWEFRPCRSSQSQVVRRELRGERRGRRVHVDLGGHAAEAGLVARGVLCSRSRGGPGSRRMACCSGGSRASSWKRCRRSTPVALRSMVPKAGRPAGSPCADPRGGRHFER